MDNEEKPRVVVANATKRGRVLQSVLLLVIALLAGYVAGLRGCV